MIVVVKRSHPDLVFATHADRQLDEVHVLYPDDTFELRTTDAVAQPRKAVPADAAPVPEVTL